MADSFSKSSTLLDNARQGDFRDLGRLLESYRNYLAILARQGFDPRLQGKLDASDLVQETFVEAIQSFSHFRGETEGHFLAWLRRILASRLSAASRRFLLARARDVRLEDRCVQALDRSSAALQRLAASQTTPSEHVFRHERAVLLADALASIPDDYREVILLRHVEGLPFNMVAQRMGRTTESVRHLWVRGLAALHTRLCSGLGDEA